MQDLNDLYYFAQVVDHGGFAPAGRALKIPKSTLSRRISALEERLGMRLIQRSTRRFSVTPIGETYYGHCKAMLAEAEAAQEAIDFLRAEPRGLVRISCPVALLHARIGPMVADFMQRHPQITVQIKAFNRPVDVIAEGFDMALRVRRLPLDDSDLILRALGPARPQLIAASPALVKRLGMPKVPVDLARYPSLDSGPVRHDYHWELEGPGGARASVRYEPRLITDDLATLRTAATAGLGIVHLPQLVVENEMRRGELLSLLPGWAPPPEMVHAVLPSKRCMLPAVRALMDDLTQQFEKMDAG